MAYLIERVYEDGTRTVKYKSDNGYTGIMYGRKSFAVQDETGKEVMHTGSRNFNNIKDLMDHVDNFPKFREVLLGISVSTQGSDTK